MKWSKDRENSVNFKVLERCTAVADELTVYDDITFEVFAAVVQKIKSQQKITWDEIKKTNPKTYNFFENRFKDENTWSQTFGNLKQEILHLGVDDERLLKKMFKDF